ncbi:XRE family transcriptional regulator [Acidovorax sp. NCPPB 3576]|uniref:XRE family transcriptional regulator n=1 Tax=Acidovorax sp. NCPPB 3576 TaxID=2940488 RepID=UPI00234AB559|nr:S24 family peptidase [Acidovorax sp. NCPPB 3576]WCM88822.1 helix-turn-helix domain-containing protein [Acidovorax sp. NCPPB 3576]
MQTLAQRIRSARTELGITQVELAKRAEMKQSDVSKLERGDSQKTSNLIRLAMALAVNPQWLDTGDGPRRPEESNVAAAPMLGRSRLVPVVGHVKAGPDGYLEEMQYPVGHGEGCVEYWTKDEAAYALRIKGDSMHPRYRAREFIVVTPSIEAQQGNDVVVRMRDGRKLLKQLNWQRPEELQLLSINDGYAPMTLDTAEVDSIHRVGGSVPPDAFIEPC